MKLFIIFFVLVLWINPVISQIRTENIILRPIKTYNVDFYHADSVIDYTLFVASTGKYTFREGHNRKSDYLILPDRDEMKKDFYCVDTIIPVTSPKLKINSYFPTLLSDSTKEIWDSTILVYNGSKWKYETRDFFPPYKHHFYNELRYSYILKGVGLTDLYHSDKDSTIRIFVPNEINDDLNDIYEVDLSNEKIKIFYTSFSHSKNASFRIHSRDSVIVTKKREIRDFYKAFSIIEFSNDTYFEKFDYSTRYFIEFKTKENYYAFKREYLDERGNYPEDSLPLVVYGLYNRNIKKKR